MMSASLVGIIEEDDIDLLCSIVKRNKESLSGKLISFKVLYLSTSIFNVVVKLQLQQDCINTTFNTEQVVKLIIKDKNKQSIIAEYDVESLKYHTCEINIKTFELIFMLSTVLDNK